MSAPHLTPRGLDVDGLRRLLASQSGVVSRVQVLELGGRPHDLERLVRRRELALVHPGVYVDHTGEPTWQQRAWAAVLVCWPAALAGDSALRAGGGPGWRGQRADAPIEVAVSLDRTVRSRAGVRVRRMAAFDSRVLWNTSPPRVRVEEAVLDRIADLADDWDRIEKAAAVCRSRMTTAARLQQTLADRSRFPQRAWLTGVLTDLGAGTCSVLEHGYLVRIERAHGLPAGRRQTRDVVDAGTIYRDVSYPSYGVEVELDGRLWHDDLEQRDRDLDRDLETAGGDRRTVRLGWGQVFGRGCRTAVQVARVLRLGGWTGIPVACGPGCAVGPGGAPS